MFLAVFIHCKCIISVCIIERTMCHFRITSGDILIWAGEIGTVGFSTVQAVSVQDIHKITVELMMQLSRSAIKLAVYGEIEYNLDKVCPEYEYFRLKISDGGKRKKKGYTDEEKEEKEETADHNDYFVSDYGCCCGGNSVFWKENCRWTKYQNPGLSGKRIYRKARKFGKHCGS